MKPQFKYRSEKTELLDLPIKEEFVMQNMKELDFLNKYFGGYSASINALKRIVKDKNKIYHIADLGCGNGDYLRHIAQWARTFNYKVKLTGVDVNMHSIRQLEKLSVDFPEINGVACDYKEYLKEANPPDIIHCSLFCHHLNEKDFRQLMYFSKFYNNTVFIINDLIRNRYSYYASKALTFLTKASIMARHDGPISVLRSFKRHELINFFNEIGIKNYSVTSKWFYRYVVLINTENIISKI
jgi:SAM-dependent methyltransferase